jgi:hypothetical protein
MFQEDEKQKRLMAFYFPVVFEFKNVQRSGEVNQGIDFNAGEG